MKMPEKKERFELLLEEIKGDIKGVAEGHSAIRREVREMKTELKADIAGLDGKIRFLGDKIDRVEKTLEIKLTALIKNSTRTFACLPAGRHGLRMLEETGTKDVKENKSGGGKGNA
jgi:hypothetical protein